MAFRIEQDEEDLVDERFQAGRAVSGFSHVVPGPIESK
jgi:hypothetical protein